MVAPTLKGRRRRSPLLVVWAAFALLAAGALAWRGLHDSAPPRTGGPPAPARLSPEPFAAIGAVEVVNAGAWYRFERGADGRWLHHAHAVPGGGRKGEAAHRHAAPDPRRAAAIARALAAFVESPVAAARAGDAEPRGLAIPRMFVVLYRPGEDRPLAHYLVGDETPDGLGRYIGVSGAGAVFTAPKARIAALLALLEDADG